jgi:hypothetical protein
MTSVCNANTGDLRNKADTNSTRDTKTPRPLDWVTLAFSILSGIHPRDTSQGSVL